MTMRMQYHPAKPPSPSITITTARARAQLTLTRDSRFAQIYMELELEFTV